MITDLRKFLQKLDAMSDLKRISGADLKFEIGAISELAFQNHGQALLFDQIDQYPPNYRIASNVCSTRKRSLFAIGMDPGLAEDEAMALFKKRWDAFKPIPPVKVDSGSVMENIQKGEEVDLLKIPVPVWHELDGGPYIGTGLAVILKDPEIGWVNLGSYRLQRYDRYTTGVFSEPANDGNKIMRKYWAQGKACPVAVSLGPEPIIFLTAAGCTGCPKGVPEYDYAGFLMGEPIPIVEGPLTGLPISANSEIAIEGEIPPPQVEARPEGPFGEWTGYYMGGSVPEPVIRVKALYHRTDPILFGASPLKPHDEAYSFSLPMIFVTGVWSHLQKLGIPVRRVSNPVKMGVTVITIHQQEKDDVERAMQAIDQIQGPHRLFILVDDDVNPEDPRDVLWAVSTRYDPTTGARVSTIESEWLLDPLRKVEERAQRPSLPYQRLILNGCRPFDRIKDFSAVNLLSETRRNETWNKWKMEEWASRPVK
ncbi:MAG: UbiD family decarboxylase [Deltaproteobacteria bacterium]|nr:UbiD family decarboxylase [Deltaproteobacteria bacterium]